MTSSDVAGPLLMSATYPVVSVIIPAFNRNHTLPRALASVTQQTFRDLEVIIIDDGSAQPVEQVLSSFEDPRIRLLVHPTNRGANAARNTGIGAARGKYVAFLDSDDEWIEEKLEIQVAALEQAPLFVGAHYTGYRAFSEDGAIYRETSPCISGNLLPALLRRNEIGTLSSVMVRRSVLDVVGWFDEGLPAIQDWDLYIRIAQNYEFATVGKPLLRYYLGKDSITRNFRFKAVGLVMVLEKHEDAMSEIPRAYSYMVARAGHYYCRSGLMSEGRQCFLRAAKIHPLGFRAYLYFILSLFGARVYEGVASLRRRAFSFV